MSRTSADEISSKKLSTVDITAANGAAMSNPANHGCPAIVVSVTAICGMIRSDSSSMPGRSTRAKQKIMTSGK